MRGQRIMDALLFLLLMMGGVGGVVSPVYLAEWRWMGRGSGTVLMRGIYSFTELYAPKPSRVGCVSCGSKYLHGCRVTVNYCSTCTVYQYPDKLGSS